MTRRAETPRRRRDLLEAQGVLLVTRPVPPAPPAVAGQPSAVHGDPAEGREILLAVWNDGSVTALAGHVDLGTGLRTALAQIAAEELDVAMSAVHVILGDTAIVPNQGATIASGSIQFHAAPLRMAAAQARAWLLQRAAERLGLPAQRLQVHDGRIGAAGPSAESIEDRSPTLGFDELVGEAHIELVLSSDAMPKRAADYRLVGRSAARVDIPSKALGEPVFVHDMRVPGMLHGRVVRPPYAGVDSGEFVGNLLESVDEASIAHIPGIVGVVVIRDFIGVVAQREEQAEQAMRELKVHWKHWPGLPAADDLAQALRVNPSTRRLLTERGDVDTALASAAASMPRTYVWPYQMHASIGPSCALADWRGETMTVWAGTQSPHVLRADLARLTGLADAAIEVVRMEAAGCYGRNCADDVAADAALLSRAVGRPVRVQLSREQEHLWEPKGAAQLMEVDGGLTAEGLVAAYDFRTSYPSNGAATLALLLTRTIEPVPVAYEMGDRTAVPPYDYANLRVVANDMAPILRASWLRGVSALPNSFAHESYIDELATAAGVDPVAFRLKHLRDLRAIELIEATAERAGWNAHTAAQGQPAEGHLLRGQGFAYARYTHGRFPGHGSAWATWVADVEVNRQTGEVHVSRIVVGHDAGLMINPAGVQHQIHGNVVQTTSRALLEQVEVDPRTRAVASREWGSYPILAFRDVPVIEVMMMPRQGEPPLGVGESSSVPGTAAIANAIFDATGVRFRQPPFTPEVVRAALAAGSPSSPATAAGPASTPQAIAANTSERASGATTDPLQPLPAPTARRGRRWWAIGGALASGVVGLAAGLLGAKPAIALLEARAAGLYTAEAIERGRQLAAVGNCEGCHTTPGGAVNAGGRGLETPFGIVYSTNLTPDPETGIGRWSFGAFQRAMREGLSRDGSHLYPAFPYASFTRTTDDDLTALYAYLMSQAPVRAAPPATALPFPFSLRPLMALWNALYLDAGPAPAIADRSAAWNRGEYLVNGLGHCSGCHTSRNARGRQRPGGGRLASAMIDGWEAPSLTALNPAPVPWTEDELFRYLRFGHTREHGVAGGPMAQVVTQLASLPDPDVRSMAHYLASLLPPATGDETLASRVVESSRASAPLPGEAQRLFTGACGACHHDGDGPMTLGPNLPLALNSNLHSSRPDNLVRVILDGIREPATKEVGFMPAFRDSLDERQVVRLAAWLRQRFAPDQPAWPDLDAAVARVRAGDRP